MTAGRLTAILSFVAVVMAVAPGMRGRLARDAGSERGVYRGYRDASFDGWIRETCYIPVRDGTRLAADVFRPARAGRAAPERLPVVWALDRYQRAKLQHGRLRTQLDEYPWLPALLRHGYVVVVVDVRGGGASFGHRTAPFSRREAEDLYDVTEWLARQPWSDGKIGMFGRSYLGTVQYLAAGMQPPHLKCVFAEMSLFDLYDFVYPGGVFRDDFARHWSHLVAELDSDGAVAPVLGTGSRARLAEALRAHEGNRDLYAMFAALPYRDSVDSATATACFQELSPSSYVDRIREARIPTYHFSGWFDMWPRDALLWFANLSGPQKITIGPWWHANTGGFDLAAEHLRWYDYWLKGIDNGIMDEPRVAYYTLGAAAGRAWRTCDEWPPSETQRTELYLGRGRSGSSDSVNDGTLLRQPPGGPFGDRYQVDYGTTTGRGTRWSNGYGARPRHRDMRANDARSLTYTTPPLEETLEITGHPLVHLWVGSTSEDVDLFVYLELVHENGYSQYLTEGVLRASHRAEAEPGYDRLGLPYHPGRAEDRRPLTESPARLSFDLHPVSVLVPRGKRVRISICGADCDNYRVERKSPRPTFTLHAGPDFPSRISLPIAARGGTDGGNDVAGKKARRVRADVLGADAVPEGGVAGAW